MPPRYRIAPEAEAELDEIWYYIARDSGSIDRANRVVDAITDRFYFLAAHPAAGRARDDLRPDVRSFPAEGYAILYRVADDDSPLILHVLHQSRDIAAFFGAEPPR